MLFMYFLLVVVSLVFY